MAKKAKEADVNLYYLKNGQEVEIKKDSIDDLMKRKKAREREKRIKEKNAKQEEKSFDLETETVIQMTNKNKIAKEEKKRKELSQKERKRKKRNKKIKFFLKLFLAIGFLVGGGVFAFTSPIFNIKDIQVLNNSQVSSETIISLSNLKTEDNIFRYVSSQVAQKIKENAYIEDVKVNRKLPGTIQIEVTERIASYAIDFMGKYAYINTQGYILEISDDNKGLPVIQGVSTKEEEITPNQRLAKEDLERLEGIIKIMNIAKENNLDTEVTSIDITNENEYSLYLEKEKKKIHLGDNSNLSNKMIHAVAIIEQTKGQEGEIFVNGDLNNKFRPYFKLKV